MKFTDKTIAGLMAPTHGRTWAWEWDSQLAGLGVYVLPSGKRSFCFQYRANGQSHRVTLKALTVAEARKQAADLFAQVTKGQDPSQARREALAREQLQGHTLKSVVADFMSHRGSRMRSAAQFEAALERHVLSRWGSRPIQSLKKSELVALFREIEGTAGSHAAHAVRRNLNVVGTWFAHSVDGWEWPRTPAVLTQEHRRGRERVLEPKEIRALWRTCDVMSGPFGKLCQFLLLTGLRRNEAARLHKREVASDFQSLTIPAARYKSKVDHTLPLSSDAASLLQAQAKVFPDSGWLFTWDGVQPVSNFSRPKHDLDDLLGEAVGPFTLHDLRRTSATLMGDAGVPTETIERVLGHVIGGVAGVYQRANHVDAKRAALEKLAEVVLRVVSDQ